MKVKIILEILKRVNPEADMIVIDDDCCEITVGEIASINIDDSAVYFYKKD